MLRPPPRPRTGPSPKSRSATGNRPGARPWSRCSSPSGSSCPEKTRPWISQQRQHLADIRLRALEAYAVAALGIGGTELPAAVRAGRQLVGLAPLRESGYQALMRALARQGNVAEALQVHATLREVLRDELGIAPCAATQAVYDQLLQA